jgi:amidohydrolase
MTDKEVIRKLIKEQQEYMVTLRRHFHENPEVAGTEFRTREKIAYELEQLGVPYEFIHGTGLIAKIEGGKEGKHVVLRADMDALPLAEEAENLKGPKACLSGKTEVCHACGHDAHMAMLFGAIRVLWQLRNELSGIVYCCFEEGEEKSVAVNDMLQALDKYRIDTSFAIHVYSGLESGKISLEEGPRMAGFGGIDVLFKGKSGHGSRPDRAINPIIPAAHFITSLHSAYMNQLSAEETTTLGVTCFQAGNSDNVIPETARVAGSIRFFNAAEGLKAFVLMKKLSELTAASHNCTVEYGERARIILNPVINDPECSRIAAKSFRDIYPEGSISLCPKWYASESFGRYLESYPGVLALLGIRNEELGTGAEHHNGHFDVDESVLVIGAAAEVAYVFAHCIE